MALVITVLLGLLTYDTVKDFSKSQPNKSIKKSEVSLPILGELIDFTMTERSGSAVNRKTLFGNVWIADFIFASCAATCPRMTERMSELRTELKKNGFSQVKCISISVDPDRDTPEALRFYANLYHAPLKEWLFVTGAKKQMQDLVTQSFKLDAPDRSLDDQLLHSSNFFLIDELGRIRGSYIAVTEEEENDLMHVPQNRPMPEKEKERLIGDVRLLVTPKH